MYHTTTASKTKSLPTHSVTHDNYVNSQITSRPSRTSRPPHPQPNHDSPTPPYTATTSTTKSPPALTVPHNHNIYGRITATSLRTTRPDLQRSHHSPCICVLTTKTPTNFTTVSKITFSSPINDNILITYRPQLGSFFTASRSVPAFLSSTSFHHGQSHHWLCIHQPVAPIFSCHRRRFSKTAKVFGTIC